MGTFYIYQLRVQGQKLPFYIGKGKGRRYDQHWKGSLLKVKSHKNHTITKALREGFDVYSEILADELDEATAFKLEVEWIAYYGRRSNGTGCLTNLTDGGEGSSGLIFSEYSRALVSAAQRRRFSSAEALKSLSESIRNSPKAAAHRRKLSDAKIVPEEVRRAQLAWCNPLFDLVSHQHGANAKSLFRCKHCGVEDWHMNHRMYTGRLPKDHYWCGVESFALDQGTGVYALRKGARSASAGCRPAVEMPKGVEFTFAFRKKGVVFYDTDGAELYRVRLPEPYMRARLKAEREFNTR